MSKAQYNLNTRTDYLSRKMFLDPEGPVTVQRFEEVKYNKIQKIEQTARGFFWVPEEISLSKDANDFKDASDAVKHILQHFNPAVGRLLSHSYQDLNSAVPVGISRPRIGILPVEHLIRLHQ